MTTEIRVPQLPESVADATLVAWRKQPGEAASRDENLADLETDKVVLEVPAPAAGVVKEWKVQPGTTVKSGDLLAIFEEGAKGAAAPAPAAAAPAASAAAASAKAADPKLSPADRRVVEETKVDPASVTGKGRDGRLTKADVISAASAPKAAAAPAAVAPSGPRAEQRVPMTRLRARIAERLVQAQHTAALLTTFNEVDLTAVTELRARHKDRFEKEHGVKLGFMSFFVKASIEALRKFPVMNAAVEGNDVIYHEFYDIGVAVSTDRGLVVPVLRNAENLGFAQIEKQIVEYGTRARAGSLALEDLQGGTFTITNGGVFGSLLSTPIVNAPEVAILGVCKSTMEPVWDGKQFVPRLMLPLSLTWDHRVIDGAAAARFNAFLGQILSDFRRVLL